MSTGRLGVGAAAELADLARSVAKRAAGTPDLEAEALPSGAGEASSPEPGPRDELTTTVVGALFEAADITRDAGALAWRATAPARSMVGWLAKAPPARPLTDRVTNTIDRWHERGADETAAGRDEVRGLAKATIDQVSGSDGLPDIVVEVMQPILPDVLELLADDPALIGGVVEALLPELLPNIINRLSEQPELIGGVVDAMLPDLLPEIMTKIGDEPEPILGLVNSIMGPLLTELLPQVVDQLGENPEPIRELVMGQSTSIAGDMVESVRSRAVSGDQRAERIARRLLGRKPPPELEASAPQLSVGAGDDPGPQPVDGDR